ncbi:MAG: hypothetical protein ABI832_20110 [bacterium]
MPSLKPNAGRHGNALLRQAALAIEKPAQCSYALSLGQRRVEEQDPRYLRAMSSPDYFDRMQRSTTNQVAALRAYYQGFRDSGGFAAGDTSIEAMLADMRPVIRQEVEEKRMAGMVLWIEGMSLAEVSVVMTYYESSPGVEVMAALESASQALTLQNYRDMGLVAGRFVLGSDL